MHTPKFISIFCLFFSIMVMAGHAHANVCTLATGSELTPGGSIQSCNLTYKLSFQLDGNVVLYNGSTALWATGTSGLPSAIFVMQGDGNLVLYNKSNVAIWASSAHGGSTGQPGTLLVQDNGNLLVYANADNSTLWSSNTAVIPPVALLADSSVLTDWIAKDICVDASNRPVPADPYYTCPTGTTRRKIQPGDPLPYHNTDQFNQQQSDSYILLDPNANPIYFHSFDYPPFNQFNLYSGSDGFDFYSIDKNWFSAAGTRDGGGYGTQFFSSNCSYGDGWIFFPSTGFLSGWQAQSAISGVYWEQNSMSYPGTCPAAYGHPTTSWKLQKNVPFGGINGNTVKTMDAMVSYHGFQTGHAYPMEVFWFTRQYGLTMWQSWIPASSNPTKTNNCNVPGTIQYQNVTYVAADCHDWTQITPATTAQIPQWPLSPVNILQHPHFDNGGGYLPNSDTSFLLWHRAGNSVQGNIINLSLVNSTAAQDTRNGPGVRYLATNCAGTCTGPGVQEIYQDIPISSIANGASYLFGIDARSESGTGTLQVTLQELNGNGNVLWQDSVQGNVSQDNGDGRNGEINSVYLSSAFIHKFTTIPVYTGATRLRFYITPLTSQTFDILDSWLNRFPAMKSTLGMVP